MLSDDVYAVVDNPPFNRSPYDGYALKAKYTSGIFKVIGVNYAGKPSVCKISDKEAVKIMTGAFIPDGADCVVPQEQQIGAMSMLRCSINMIRKTILSNKVKIL